MKSSVERYVHTSLTENLSYSDKSSTKTCISCNKELPIENFEPRLDLQRAGQPLRRRNQCRVCRSIQYKERQQREKAKPLDKIITIKPETNRPSLIRLNHNNKPEHRCSCCHRSLLSVDYCYTHPTQQFLLCSTCHATITNQKTVAGNLFFRGFKEINLWNEDCVSGMRRHIPDNSIDLIIADPPFGINETDFDNGFYERDSKCVFAGYKEAPENYLQFTKDWMTESVRVLRPGGHLFVVIGYTKLADPLNIGETLDLKLEGILIYTFTFAARTEKKFTNCHYQTIHFKKRGGKSTFNTYCRYTPDDILEMGSQKRSMLYNDLQSVQFYKKEYKRGEPRNGNRLHPEFIEKLIAYTTKPNDIVLDPFQGNFTTAYAARKLGRKVAGFEWNKTAFDYHTPRVRSTTFGEKISTDQVSRLWLPENRGKPFEQNERETIFKEYQKLVAQKIKSVQVIQDLSQKFKRTKASIKKIIRKQKQALKLELI
jgi:DNA modification methylase